MKHAISTTALVTMLLGTGLLVFNALGVSISASDFAPLDPLRTVPVDPRGIGVHHWYLQLWTVPQRIWMTVGALLVVGGWLFDARFNRAG